MYASNFLKERQDKNAANKHSTTCNSFKCLNTISGLLVGDVYFILVFIYYIPVQLYCKDLGQSAV